MDNDYQTRLPKCFDPRLLAKLKSLQIRARRVVDGFMAGVHRSSARGGSLEFAQHREYAPGDDPRYVDWKAFARTGRLQLKQFEDETNLVHYLVVDVSASMDYRGPSAVWSKRDYAASLAASAAWLAMANHDAVSLAMAGSADTLPSPPSMHPGQFVDLTKRLEETRSAKSDASPLAGLAGALRRRGVILLMTDALGDLDALRSDLGRLTHRGHEIRLVHILDDAEIDFPFSQAASFQDLESGAITAADPIAIAHAYRHEVDAFFEQLKGICSARRVGYLQARTSDSLEGPLRFLLSGDIAPPQRLALARSR
jgi:uncharacterized protein (DUF58 family)